MQLALEKLVVNCQHQMSGREAASERAGLSSKWVVVEAALAPRD